MQKETLKAFDTSMDQFLREKTSLMETLRKIHSRGVTILWMLIDPMRVNNVDLDLALTNVIKYFNIFSSFPKYFLIK